MWEPLEAEPAYRALDSSGQARATEVYRQLIRRSGLTAPIRPYRPPAGAEDSSSALAERLRAARERIARLRAGGAELAPLPDTAYRTPEPEVAPARRLSEEEGYWAALEGLPTQHADAPATPRKLPAPTPRPATPEAAPEPASRPEVSTKRPKGPLDRPTLGGAGVTVQPGGEGAWEGIAAGDLEPVPWGTVVRTSRTDRGRVILPGHRGTVQLEPSTEVKLVPGYIRLIRGEMRIQVPAASKTTTEIRTPKGRLKVGPGGEVRVRPGGFARVSDPVRRVG